MPPLSGVSREVWADRTTRDLPFSEIWGVDFEYVARDGDRPVPVSLYAKELLSGRAVFLFGDELTRASGPPYPTHDGALFVAYQAAAELSCHAVLGWPQPSRILDLYVESRVVTNGRVASAGL